MLVRLLDTIVLDQGENSANEAILKLQFRNVGPEGGKRRLPKTDADCVFKVAQRLLDDDHFS